MLISMKDFLKLFFQITKYTKRQYTTINRVLLLIDFFLDRYEIDALLYIVNNFIKLSIDAR